MQGQIFIFCALCEDHRNGDDTDAAEERVCDDIAAEAQVCDDTAAEAEEVQHKPDAAEAGEAAAKEICTVDSVPTATSQALSEADQQQYMHCQASLPSVCPSCRSRSLLSAL